jgi:hypothetical protein
MLSTGAALSAAEQSDYHLFNPTPQHLMRELSTDRPDTTESPITLDPGHVQIELSFLEYTREGTTDAYDIAPVNLKLGLTHFADLQLVLQPYLISDGPAGNVAGSGDTQIRLKLNLWGNDGGATAAAIMPFIQFPTGDDDATAGELEGGLIVPVGFELPAGFSLTVMAEFDCVRNSTDDGYRLDLVHTAALGRGLTERLGGFVEYIGVAQFDPNDSADNYLASAAAGLTFAVSPDVQFDAALQFGLTDAADDFLIRSGVSIRF